MTMKIGLEPPGQQGKQERERKRERMERLKE